MIRPVAWLKEKLRRETKESKTQENPFALLLVGFEYDELTNETIQWFKELSVQSSLRSENIYRIHDVQIRREQLSTILKELKTQRRVTIFCGHGDYDALLGPPLGSISDVSMGDTSHAVIYDHEMISTAHGSMFAFCCRAGKSLGRSFGALEGKVFLGFKDDLPMHLKDYFLSPLKNIFLSVAQDVINSRGVLANHEILLKRSYDEAINQFLYESDCEHRFLMRLYLTEHKSQIRRFGSILSSV